MGAAALHISVTTYSSTRVLLLREQLLLNRVLYAFFLSNCLSKGPVSLQHLLNPVKAASRRGRLDPSVYPLKYVLGFQVNVCDLCFLT